MSHYVTDDFDIMKMSEHTIKEYVLTDDEEKTIYENINNLKI